jgi:2-hydroxycyclohexanecarboxyl-CoA dehydrogenase
MDMFDLHHANVLVTGAGQGVGRQIAIDLAANGAGTVLINDVSEERAEKVAREIDAAGGTARVAIADVTNFEAVSALCASSISEVGGIDIVVNNAGNYGANPTAVARGNFWEIGPENWTPLFDVNLRGPMNTARAALPSMIERGRGGRLITIISDAGRVGEPGLEAYSAAKAGAAGFTRAIAKAVGRFQITANNVAISATRTPTTSSRLEDDEQTKRMLSRYVIRRVGEPSDVSAVVLLLASPAASWITGQTYAVNGGYSFGM